MKCELCDGRPPEDDVSLHRLNATGVTGRWACDGCAWRFGSYAKRLGKQLPRDVLTDAEIDDAVCEARVEMGTS